MNNFVRFYFEKYFHMSCVEETTYEDFYDEIDNRIELDDSMNMIFFGPPSSFLRLDAESILHILTNTKKDLIPISRTLLAWDVVTGNISNNYLSS